MGPGPRFEPESQDPQSRRMTAYPTPAYEYPNRIKTKIKDNAGAGIRTLVDLRQQVLSLSPLAARTPPLIREGRRFPKNLSNIKNAPTGIRTRVFGSKGRNDWPDYTTGATNKYKFSNMGPMGFEPMAFRL